MASEVCASAELSSSWTAFSADAFAIGNLTLFSKEIVKGLEASGSIYNLLDTKYSAPGAGGHLQDTISQDGRSFRLKLTYKF